MDAFLEREVLRGSRVGAVYAVPTIGWSAERLATERARLTVTPRSSFGSEEVAPVRAYEEEAGVLRVPRFYGLARFGPAEVDERTDGVRCEERLVFTGTLTPVQRQAAAALEGKEGAIVCLPCGMGKTVFAVALACALGRRTAVLVHKAVLRDQWRETFERFCPGVRVGLVQGATCEVEDRDVVVCMVMTLAKREADPRLFEGCGLVVVDEAHHMAAPVMSRAMRWFNARRVLGLTATKERPDGLTPLLHWSLGPEGFRAERTSEERVRVSVALFRGGTREILTKDGKPLAALMITNLAKHGARNAFLAERIVALRRTGRVLMVLSDRLAQLETLRALVIARGLPEAEVGVFKGGQRDAERVAQLARPVVMCSYGMANEGVDKKEADTCVMATPKGRVVQCIGRVQRPCADKQPPLVVDVVDEDVPLFDTLRWTRHRLYRKEKYDVQTLAADAPTDAWFA